MTRTDGKVTRQVISNRKESSGDSEIMAKQRSGVLTLMQSKPKSTLAKPESTLAVLYVEILTDCAELGRKPSSVGGTRLTRKAMKILKIT